MLSRFQIVYDWLPIETIIISREIRPLIPNSVRRGSNRGLNLVDHEDWATRWALRWRFGGKPTGTRHWSTEKGQWRSRFPQTDWLNDNGIYNRGGYPIAGISAMRIPRSIWVMLIARWLPFVSVKEKRKRPPTVFPLRPSTTVATRRPKLVNNSFETG